MVAQRFPIESGHVLAGSNPADPNSADPNSADPNSADPNSADPNSADPNSADPKRTSTVLHAEQRFTFTRPVRVGEVLSTTVRPVGTWEKRGRKGGAMVSTESVTEYRDAGGEVVATATAVAVSTQPVGGAR